MKLRKYLIRTVVGAAAFLFGIGIFATWRYLQTAPPAPLPAYDKDAEVEAYRLRETYPMMPSEADTVTPVAKTETATETGKFDAEGYYYISADNTPKGFDDFENFSITSKDYKTENEEDYGKLIAPEGYVQANRELKFSRISIGDYQIRFETERVKGISYSFSGEFTETRNFNYLESEDREKVLKGVLTKKRNGKKIAEAQVDFGWFLEMSCGC